MRTLLAAFLCLSASLAAAQDGAPAGRPADRIVSLGGSVTEILYALGLEERIVAVDTTSLYPPQALKEKPNVGYLRRLSAEGVIALDPTLIVAEQDVGPPETVALLEQARIPFLRVPDARDAESLRRKIEFVADAVDAGEAGHVLAERAATELDSVTMAVDAVDEPVSAIFVLSVQGGRILAAGEGTSADAMLRLAGARNALSGFSGFKQVSSEALISAAPQVIVMMERGEGPTPALDEVLSVPALAATPAGTERRVVTMDGIYLLGFGPRTGRAARDLAAAFYPSLDLPDFEGGEAGAGAATGQ